MIAEGVPAFGFFVAIRGAAGFYPGTLPSTMSCALACGRILKRSGLNMASNTVQLTAAGRTRLEDELAHLRDVKRKELAERIEASNDDGDISDNSEYEELKEELVLADRRIQELEYILATAETIETPSDGVIGLGSNVTLRDSEGEEASWILVDPAEADTRAGSISTQSPVGSVLMGKSKGDQAEVSTPGGTIVYTILNVA
jgi:transcription elongation factor GreA